MYEDDAPVTVTYNTIEGFYSPSNEDITTLTEDKNITGTYTAIPEYTLTANITGPVEAKWSIDGTTWNDSGVVLTLYEGTYDVVYKDVPGYAPVATEHVDLNANTVVTATYVMASFALTVNVTGATGAQ